jgi:hypothetical protein
MVSSTCRLPCEESKRKNPCLEKENVLILERGSALIQATWSLHHFDLVLEIDLVMDWDVS